MTLEQKILKSVLLLRKINKSESKKEQLKMFSDYFTKDKETELDNYIKELMEDFAKTDEQREEESRIFCELLAEREAEQLFNEMQAEKERYWNEHDEWFDYWNSRF